MAAWGQGITGLAHSQEDFKAAITAQINQFTDQMQQFFSRPEKTDTSPAPEPSPVPTMPYDRAGAQLASPERFSGEQGQCKSFLIDCEMHYEFSPHVFLTDRAKITFMISHLVGRATIWATAEWVRESPLCSSLRDFKEALQKTFDPVS